MSKSKKKLVLTLIAALILTMIPVTSADAASASCSFSGGGTYNVGDTVTLTLAYSGDTFGAAETEIVYDSSHLQYQSCSAIAGGGSGKVTVSMSEGGKSSMSCTVTFKALKPGSSSVTATTVDLYNLNGDWLQIGTKSVSVSVKDNTPTLSSNANLSSIRISAGSLSPSFSPSTTSYTVKVGNDVNNCSMSVQVADSRATYTISGSSSLSVGKNVRKIVVTAENGTTKTYTVSIYREEKSTSGNNGNAGNGNAGNGGEGEETEKPEPEPPEEIETTVGDKTYIICENLDKKDIPQGFTMTVAKFGEYEIPAFKDKELKYTFVLLKDKETGDESWFFFDEESDTFAPAKAMSADVIIAYEEALAKASGNKIPQGAEKSNIDNNILFIALGATMLLLLIVVITLQVKIIKNKNKKETA